MHGEQPEFNNFEKPTKQQHKNYLMKKLKNDVYLIMVQSHHLAVICSRPSGIDICARAEWKSFPWLGDLKRGVSHS
jgi:hypothetical protein